MFVQFTVNKLFLFYKSNSLIYPLELDFNSIDAVARVTDNRTKKDVNVNGCK